MVPWNKIVRWRYLVPLDQPYLFGVDIVRAEDFALFTLWKRGKRYHVMAKLDPVKMAWIVRQKEKSTQPKDCSYHEDIICNCNCNKILHYE